MISGLTWTRENHISLFTPHHTKVKKKLNISLSKSKSNGLSSGAISLARRRNWIAEVLLLRPVALAAPLSRSLLAGPHADSARPLASSGVSPASAERAPRCGRWPLAVAPPVRAMARLRLWPFLFFLCLFLCCFSFFRWLTLLVLLVAWVVVVDGGGG